MTLPKDIANYEAVRRVCDAALEHGGLMHHFETSKQAVRWRNMAYNFRKLAAKRGEHQYDSLEFLVRDTAVLVRRQQTGRLTDMNGKELNV